MKHEIDKMSFVAHHSLVRMKTSDHIGTCFGCAFVKSHLRNV